MVVAVAPARRMPWNAMMKAAVLGQCSATTSPGLMPRAASAPAKASIRARRSPYVVSVPVAESKTAMRPRSSSLRSAKR